MKHKRYKSVAGITILIAIVLLTFFFIKDHFIEGTHDWNFFLELVFTVLVSVSIILANFPLFDKIKAQFPLKKGIFKRLFLIFIVSSINAAAIITFWVLIFFFFVNNTTMHHLFQENGLVVVIFTNAVTAIIVNFAVGSILFLRFAIIGWKNSFVEAEQYKRKSIESQFSALVSQINPHFLFNSMNALASLIPQSPEKAVDFVNKFSKIYRYVLDVKDKLVCEVKEELEFLNAYCYLQKIRFGDNLQIDKKIETDCLNYFLPPLSLQLLVENALKHNEVSKSHPLKITIISNGEFIHVTNNLQLKQSKEDSPGIGLKNLKERYGHLTDLKPQFYIKNNEYIAKLPIIREE